MGGWVGFGLDRLFWRVERAMAHRACADQLSHCLPLQHRWESICPRVGNPVEEALLPKSPPPGKSGNPSFFSPFFCYQRIQTLAYSFSRFNALPFSTNT